MPRPAGRRSTPAAVTAARPRQSPPPAPAGWLTGAAAAWRREPPAALRRGRRVAGVDALGVLARPGQQRRGSRAQRACSCPCVPSSTSRPSSRTAIRSASCERRAAVRDQQRGAPGHDLAQRGMDLRLDPRVDRRGGVVQEQDAGSVSSARASGDPLPLAAGQGQALLADHGVVAVRQAGDELVGLSGPGRGDDLLVRGAGPAVGDVGADRVGEQEAVLASPGRSRRAASPGSGRGRPGRRSGSRRP